MPDAFTPTYCGECARPLGPVVLRVLTVYATVGGPPGDRPQSYPRHLCPECTRSASIGRPVQQMPDVSQRCPLCFAPCWQTGDGHTSGRTRTVPMRCAIGQTWREQSSHVVPGRPLWLQPGRPSLSHGEDR